MGNLQEQTLHPEDWHRRRRCASPGSANENHGAPSLHDHQNASDVKEPTRSNTDKGAEKQGSPHQSGVSENGAATLKTVWQLLRKLNPHF